MSSTDRQILRECLKCRHRRPNRDANDKRTINCPGCGQVVDNDQAPIEEPLHVSDMLCSYAVRGLNPVEADGQLLDYTLRFTATPGNWQLIFCLNDPDPRHPSRITPPDETGYGFFRDGELEGFIFAVEYELDSPARMEFEEVQSIIDNCSEEFMAQLARREDS